MHSVFHQIHIIDEWTMPYGKSKFFSEISLHVTGKGSSNGNPQLSNP